MAKNGTAEELNKMYSLKLKNGKIVELTKQDVIDNNISKLEEAIPELKFSTKEPHKNPVEKIITKLEVGAQNKFLYYKFLSCILIGCLCLVQAYEMIQNSLNSLPMFFITVWGIFLTIILYKKRQTNQLTLLSILKNKSNFFIYSYLFNISLIVSLILFIFSSNYANSSISWTYFMSYPVIVTALISFLSTIHNIDIVYKTYIMRIHLKFITHTSFAFSLVLMVLLFFAFGNFLLREMDESEIYITIFLYSICYISAVLVNNIILLTFILIQTLFVNSK